MSEQAGEVVSEHEFAEASRAAILDKTVITGPAENRGLVLLRHRQGVAILCRAEEPEDRKWAGRPDVTTGSPRPTSLPSTAAFTTASGIAVGRWVDR